MYIAVSAATSAKTKKFHPLAASLRKSPASFCGTFACIRIPEQSSFMGRERRAMLCGENPPSIHACLTPGLRVKLVSGMGEGWEISYIRYGRSYFSLWYRKYFGCISSNQFSTFKNLWAYMSWPHVFAWCGTCELIETKITMLRKSISR